MTAKISINDIKIFDQPNEYGIEGRVRYHIEEYSEYTKDFYVEQPFWQKGADIVDNQHVWHWNGNKENPSLDPSFLMDAAVRVHLYLRNGKIELLGDSTVILK